MKWKRITAAMLVIALTITTVVSCSNTTKEKKEDEQKVAMGRYVEEAVEMPEAVASKDEVAYMITKNTEKKLEIYSSPRSLGETVQYILQSDNIWERSVPKWLNQEDMMILSITYATDGTRYAIAAKYGNDKVKIHILKSSNNEEAQEIAIDEFKDEVDYGSMPMEIEILSEGRLLLSYYDHFTIYKEGKAEITIASGNYNYALSASRDQIMCVNEKGDGVTIADTNTGKIISEISYQGDIDSMAFTSDQSGNWYIVDNSGISRLIKGGSIWETIVDGALASMSMPSYSMDAILAGEKDDFYVMYQHGEGERDIKHYIYDETIPSTPAETLTIISLEENATVRQAIAEFQLKNSNVLVDYRTVVSKDDTTTVTDQIKTINTELLAGKGADIYILDDMPVDAYIEKGVLADMSDIIEPLAESGDLLTNIIDSYNNDAIYFAPIRFIMPIAFGAKDAVNSISDIQSLADYAENNAKVPLFGEECITSFQLTSKLYQLYSQGFIGENNKFDREGLIQFLEQLKIICKQTKAIEVEDDSYSYDEDYDSFFAAQLIYDGLSELGLTNIYWEFDIYPPMSAIDQTEGVYTSINSQFIPSGLVGLNKASTRKELAGEFIKELYSEEVQNTYLGDGLPVNRKALENVGMEPNDYYFGGSNNFEATQPSKDKMQGIIDLAKTLNNPIEVDMVLMEMVIAEAIPYLKGEADAQSVADKIINKTTAYLAE